MSLGDPNLVATVFAPTNLAFSKLAKDLNLNQTELLHSYILKPTLLYHIVPGIAASVRPLVNLHSGSAFRLPRESWLFVKCLLVPYGNSS